MTVQEFKSTWPTMVEDIDTYCDLTDDLLEDLEGLGDFKKEASDIRHSVALIQHYAYEAAAAETLRGIDFYFSEVIAFLNHVDEKMSALLDLADLPASKNEGVVQ